jgi:hypothetical protein
MRGCPAFSKKEKMNFARKRILIKLKRTICFPWVLLTLGFWMALAFVRGLENRYLKLQYRRLRSERDPTGVRLTLAIIRLSRVRSRAKKLP